MGPAPIELGRPRMKWGARGTKWGTPRMNWGAPHLNWGPRGTKWGACRMDWGAPQLKWGPRRTKWGTPHLNRGASRTSRAAPRTQVAAGSKPVATRKIKGGTGPRKSAAPPCRLKKPEKAGTAGKVKWGEPPETLPNRGKREPLSLTPCSMPSSLTVLITRNAGKK